jgi:virginiamycin B lyase
VPSRILSRAAVLCLLAATLATASALAAPTIDGEFSVPNLGSNDKLVQGPDGNMWVTLNGTEYDVARITPGGEVTEFKLGAVTPLGITSGPKGLLWIARTGGVISFDPADPEGSKKITDIGSIGASPSIVLGPDGNLWATGENKLVRVPPDNPAGATEVPVPGLQTAKDIDVAGSLIVVAGLERIYAVTTAGVITEHKVSGQAQGVAGNPNGQYAFTQPVNPPKEIGLLSPSAAPIVRSAEGTDPFGIALGSDGAYWSPEFISDGLTRLTAAGQLSGLTGFAKGSGPRQIAAGPGNTLWVTLETTQKVGRVSGLEPPVAPLPPSPSPAGEPQTRIAKGPKSKVRTRRKRVKVKFRFNSPNAGATFECALLRLKKRKKGRRAPRPRFKRCTSPRAYTVRPGRYRFLVRAVLDGIVDSSPAKRTFRIVRVRRARRPGRSRKGSSKGRRSHPQRGRSPVA